MIWVLTLQPSLAAKQPGQGLHPLGGLSRMSRAHHTVLSSARNAWEWKKNREDCWNEDALYKGKYERWEDVDELREKN